jgi:hypothetical protein
MLDPQELFDVGFFVVGDLLGDQFFLAAGQGFTCSNQPSMAGSLPSSDTGVDSALTMCHTALLSSALYDCHPWNRDRSNRLLELIATENPFRSRGSPKQPCS